jgi:hypothetical protein
LFKSNQQIPIKQFLGKSLGTLLNLYTKYCADGGSSKGQPLTAEDEQVLTKAGEAIEKKLSTSPIATQLLGNFGGFR